MKIAITGIRGIPANYGGFETCAEETATRFAVSHDVTVFCRKHNSTYPEKVYRGVTLVRLPSINNKHLDTLSHTFLSILRIISDPKIRVVHLYNAANSIYIPLMKIFGKKVVVSVDGLEWKREKWGLAARMFHRISERICVLAADKIIADSRVVRDYYVRKYNVEPEYIPYGPQVDQYSDPALLEKYGLKSRGYFLFVGRLVPEKGVHNLIAGYNKANINIPLVIVGDDSSQKEYIKSLRKIADDRVRFLGFVYGRDYQAINRFPYVYVTSSMLEGTSPALISAMGAGNCVLVNGIEENRAAIGDAGFWYSENSVDELSGRLKTLADNPGLVEEYRQRALLHVKSNYNWDNIADQYISIFSELIGISKPSDDPVIGIPESERELEPVG